MRRSSDSSQFHDESQSRRRIRRTSSQDTDRLGRVCEAKGRVPEMADSIPTSPYKQGAMPFMLSPSGTPTSSHAIPPVSPHRGASFSAFPYSQPSRSQGGELSPRSPYPHQSVMSPSRYQSAPPMYTSPTPSPSSGLATPSCSTSSNPNSTFSRETGAGLKSPDFFGPGMTEAPQLSPARTMGEASYPMHSPSHPERRLSTGSGFPGPEDFKFHKEQYTSTYGASGAGTVHHHGYGPLHLSQRPYSVTSPTGYPTQPSPTCLNPRSQPPFSAASPVNPPSFSISKDSGNPNALGTSNMLSIPPGKAADSAETARLRQLVIDFYAEEMEKLKSNFREKLQELFFLQNGGNLMDYPQWKRRPNPQLLAFLNGNRLDDDVSMTTPTATNTISPSTHMPPGYSWPRSETGVNYSFQRQVYEPASLDHHRVPLPSGYGMNPNYPQLNIGNGSTCPNVSPFTGNISPRGILTTAPPPFSRSMSVPNPSEGNAMGYSNTRTSVTESTSHIPGYPGTLAQQSLTNGPLNHGGGMPPGSVTRSHSLSAVLENSIGSNEEIVLEAKREAEVLKAVGELRKDGLWSDRRLPKMQEMPRKKAHWDYLIEEMQWLAADFVQERRWKRGVAKKLSRAVLKYHQEQKSKEMKAEKEESLKLRRIAGSIAKEIKHFWMNVEKVVQYKVQSRLEENRKKALDLHLNFIVDQTEKYSSWLVASLKTQSHSNAGSHSSSVTSPVSSRPDTGGESEFEAADESDDEETIEVAERAEGQEKVDHRRELDLLQQEGEIPLEELLQSLPPEMLEEWSSSEESGSDTSSSDEDGSGDDGSQESEGEDMEVDVEGNEDKLAKSKELVTNLETKEQVTTEQSEGIQKKSDADEEFVVTEDLEEGDDEQTLEEEEKLAGKEDHGQEIAALQKEGEIPIDELLKQYSAAEMEESTDIQSDDGSVDELSSEEFDDDEDEEEDEITELLVKGGDESGQKKDPNSSPDQKLTDAAATAESLQPKGFTLETTEIQTKVPFLLRGTLREYQMIGLDWLVTMHEKRLNGILADEMGLGKTIQTIALLAHLACDKGIWGPHLIVVPTSVMLNWELELKKWCPGFKVLTYFGNQKERKAKRQGWTKPNAFHVCITSYKLVVQDHQAFRRKKWKYFVLDEAQNIKNFKSQRWQYLLNFNSQRRLLLTGTPLQNSLMELWSLMHFLMPHLFQSHKDFQQWFSNPLTGMIEGSQEYNESIIKRLHKVLRPFLLRRLKLEVEKQMPKKYEHVVRCRLSKRQRYLYDDYMSRAKTKETLESGHFLSVINILMQLRKVCNHPDLFETRQTVSAFQMDCIVYYTASLVLTALDYDPFTCVNFGYLNLSLADVEREVTSYASFRTRCLQTPKRLIVEIDSYPETTRPIVPPAKHRPPALPCGSSFQISQVAAKSKVSNSVHAQLPYPPYVHPPPYPHAQDHRSYPYTPAGSYSQLSWASDPATAFGTHPFSGSLLSTPSRVYSAGSEHHTHGYLTRQSSPGFDFNGTSMGYLPTDYSRGLPPPPPYSAPHVSSNFRQFPAAPGYSGGVGFSPSPGSGHEIKLDPSQLHAVPATVGGIAHIDHLNNVTGSKKDATYPKPFPVSPTKKIALDGNADKTVDIKSPFYLPKVVQRQSQERKQKLARLTVINSRRCQAQPVYGMDLFAAVSVVKDISLTTSGQHRLGPTSDFLREIIKFPLQRLDQLQQIVKRFVFVVPKAEAPRIQLHASHRAPCHLMREKHLKETLHKRLISKTTCLHPIMSRTKTQFPELRLIQYDCGKLQTLDVLLRKLKSEKHRVLIFTQMTKMLDVLERFLNYHGHIYLRLDGTTRVEQRQILMERFNADARIFIFILSTRSGGLGVNLTGADTVIFYDSDWNPTMDAQAQDRCHRIGQTRDVHIYRLISELTIEENILKKANQKRLLGDIAIEGGNFTTAFFKEASIKELFKVEETKEEAVQIHVASPQEAIEEAESVEPTSEAGPEVPSESALLEQALCKAEDEQDALAATMVKAEQAAELAEFSEGPVEESAEDKQKEEESSKVEEELLALEGQLTPVERYAVRFLESSGVYITVEQIKAAEKEVELAKKDWELGHLQALKEEEEKRAAEEEDEILFTYSREDATQVKKSKSKSSKSKQNIKKKSRYSKSKDKRKVDAKKVRAGSQTSQDSGAVRDSRCSRSQSASESRSRSSSCSSVRRVTRHSKS